MTPRVLHLLDLGAGEEPTLACRAALAIPGFEHELWVLGGSAEARAAAAASLGPAARIAPPLGAPELALPGARALLRDRRRRGVPPPDVVQAWSPRAHVCGRVCFGRGVPAVALATRNPLLRTTTIRAADRWADRALTRRGPLGPVTLVLRMSHWEPWLHFGGADVRLAPLPVPADADASPARRARLRRLLGISKADDAHTVVVVLIADPARTGDARRFSFIMGLMHTVGRHVVGVVPRGCGALRPAARFVRAHGRRWGLVESPLPLSVLAPAADLAVWKSPHGGGAIAAAYAAAGIPVVTATPDAAEDVTRAVPGAAVIPARGPEPRAIAAAILPIADAAAAAPPGSRPRAAAATQPGAPAGADFRSLLAELWHEVISVPGVPGQTWATVAHPS